MSALSPPVSWLLFTFPAGVGNGIPFVATFPVVVGFSYLPSGLCLVPITVFSGRNLAMFQEKNN